MYILCTGTASLVVPIAEARGISIAYPNAHQFLVICLIRFLINADVAANNEHQPIASGCHDGLHEHWSGRELGNLKIVNRSLSVVECEQLAIPPGEGAKRRYHRVQPSVPRCRAYLDQK